MAAIDIKNTTVRLKDGAGHSVELKVGEGTLTYSEKKPRNYIKERGKLGTVRNADEEPVDVSLDLIWENLTNQGTGSGALATPEDALKKRGPASTWTSSSSDPCEPFALDIEVENDPECSSGMLEVTTIADFRYETLDHDLKAGTLKVTGKANVVEATSVRVAQTA